MGKVQLLKQLQNKLIDLSTANPLISFNESRKSFFYISRPGVEVVFRNFWENDGYAVRVYEGDGQRKPESDEIELYNPRAPRQRVLNYIYKNYRQIMKDRGINVLYIAFGFVVYVEKGVTCKAPLLLVPVEMKKSGKGSYVINEREDEAILNPALEYKLAIKNEIELPRFGKDSDYRAYMEEVKELLGKSDIRLEERAILGMFSYEKICMYADIDKNGTNMLKNKTISALLGEGSLAGSIPKDCRSVKGVENNVVDADSSQQRAISCAMEGYSFVLQGPPGTGKSQTITNIIAGLLYGGKKVLFVSEKMAALQVVRNKLLKAGLGDYCLELHSMKANKKEFIKEINYVLRLDKDTYDKRKSDDIKDRRAQAEKDLSDYREALGTVLPVLEMTVYELFGTYTEVSGAPDTEFTILNIDSRNRKDLNKTLSLIDEYVIYCKDGTDPDFNASPWKCVKKEIGLSDKTKITDLLKELSATSGELIGEGEILGKYGIVFEYPSDAEEIYKLVEAFNACKGVFPRLFDTGYRKDVIMALKEYISAKKENEELKARTREYFDDGVLSLDTDAMRKRFDGYAGWTRIFNGGYRKDMRELERYVLPGKKKEGYDRMLLRLGDLSDRKDSEKRLNDAEKRLDELDISPEYVKEIDGIEKFHKLISECSLNVSAFISMSGRELKRAKAEIGTMCYGLRRNLETFENLLTEADKVFKDFTRCYAGFAEVKDRADTLYAEAAGFESYIARRNLATEMKKNGNKDFIETVSSEGIPPEKWKDCYKKRFYSQWIEKAKFGNRALRLFSTERQNEAVRSFCNADEMAIEAARKYIPGKLNLERDVIPYGKKAEFEKDKADFIKEAAAKRGKKPIRKLLMEMPEFIQKLKPCFMMSPLSVSAFLCDTDMKFDVVIFDEASQVMPEDALCSIFRGKQVIIVGDSQQMPPNDIFSLRLDSVDEDDDYEEGSADFEDMGESILELGSRVMDNIKLKWHYRSRNERLIAFSNDNFYEGSLQTFPGPVDVKEDCGVEHVFVPDGIYVRKDKNNPVEAEKVVDLVFEHIKKHPERSLGVVSFGLKQRDAIENRINKRREKLTDPDEIAAANVFFSESADEPFFVKNLETVQGDERDTVIFSMGYGKDTDGKFAQRFGPLNNVGGERRLNVAVTRAKINIKLVTSVHASEITVTDKTSEGTKLLKDYIDYAENPRRERGGPAVRDGILRSVEDDVYEYLVSEGFEVERNVGASSYKIDLAVKRPGSDEFVVAIECDGKGYQQTKNTRDRDRLRRNVLSDMGWKVYRVWSAQWITDKEEEKIRLLGFVTLALA